MSELVYCVDTRDAPALSEIISSRNLDGLQPTSDYTPGYSVAGDARPIHTVTIPLPSRGLLIELDDIMAEGICRDLPPDSRDCGPTDEEYDKLQGAGKKVANEVWALIEARDAPKKATCSECSQLEVCRTTALQLKPSQEIEVVFGGMTKRNRDAERNRAKLAKADKARTS